MKVILQTIGRFLPVTTGIIFILFFQLLFVGTNIIGVFLFSHLYTRKEIYKAIVASFITTIIYDSVKIIPLGSWSLSFFMTALPILILFGLLKVQSEHELDSWPTTMLLNFFVILSAMIQAYVIMKLSGHSQFDFTQLYSIVFLSTVIVITQKFTHKKERKLLLD